MIQAIENYALVEIEKKFQDSNGNIIIDTTWFPEEHATLEGIVVSPPIRTINNRHRQIIGTIAPGDKIFFSYGVVFDYTLQPDEDTPVYKNIILYEGREYWRVEMGEIFCKIEDAGVQMITEHVLITPGQSKEEGTVIGGPPGFREGEAVCFEAKFVQEYSIMGRMLFIVPVRKILAKQ